MKLRLYYINILKQELDRVKTHEHNLLNERYVVDMHRFHMAGKLCVFGFNFIFLYKYKTKKLQALK